MAAIESNSDSSQSSSSKPHRNYYHEDPNLSYRYDYKDEENIP